VLFLAPSRLGQCAIVVSSLAAASVVNVGGGFAVGISPYFFAAAVIAARMMSRLLTGRIRFGADEPILGHVRTLALFVAWGVASAMILPVLFSGMPVDLGRIGVDTTFFALVPLHWTFSNVGQAGYLVLDLCLVLLFLRNASRPGYIEGLVEAFTWSGLIVVGVGVYQMLSFRIHLPFPKEFFYSNQVWAELEGEGIAGWQRINATFPEASAAGDFLAMWSVFELVLAARGGRQGTRHWWFALAGSFMVANTTSTTGYVTLALAWTFFIWKYVLAPLLEGRVAVKSLLAAALIVVAILAAFAFGPDSSSLLSIVLVNKLQTSSATHRFASVYHSGNIFLQSFGLGVGLGSDRALSSAAYILANLGIIGVVLFVYLLWQLYALGKRRNPTGVEGRQERIWFEALGWALVVQLLAMIESGAEITGPSLWIPWAILAAIIRRNSLRSARTVPAAIAPAYPLGA
jgi:hypothetical protein